MLPPDPLAESEQRAAPSLSRQRDPWTGRFSGFPWWLVAIILVLAWGAYFVSTTEDYREAFEQFPFAVQALVAGDIDAVIIDETAGQGYLGANAEDLKLVGPSMSSDELGFIFPKGSDLVEPVNAALESMMDDGKLNEFNAIYFGPDFNCDYTDTGISCGG